MPPAPEGTEALLVVSSSYTQCSHCNGNAFPDEPSHQRLAGPGKSGRPGCGAVFIGITTGYRNITDEALRAMRPDLPIVRGPYDRDRGVVAGDRVSELRDEGQPDA